LTDLKNVDALIAAAWRSLEQRPSSAIRSPSEHSPTAPVDRSAETPSERSEDDEPAEEAIPTATPVATPRSSGDDPISDLVTSAVAAALGDLNLDELEIEVPDARPAISPASETIEVAAPAGHTAKATVANEPLPDPIAAAKTSKSDIVEGVIGRVKAAIQFADSNPRHPYERVETTRLLEEVTQALRQLREKRDENQKQMERWFLQWRASEAHALELSSELTRVKGLLEQQTALLVMARAFAAQGDVRVEWRDRNSWVIVLNDHVLNKDKKWEIEDRESEEPDYVERTRYTLSEAISRATALKIISND
jgi:hypothetical protein